MSPDTVSSPWNAQLGDGRPHAEQSADCVVASGSAPAAEIALPFVPPRMNNRLANLRESRAVSEVTFMPGVDADGKSCTLVHFVLGEDVVRERTVPRLDSVKIIFLHDRVVSCFKSKFSYETVDEAIARFYSDFCADAESESLWETVRDEIRAARERGEPTTYTLECENDSTDEMFGDGNEDCRCINCKFDEIREARCAPSSSGVPRIAPSSAVPSYIQMRVVPRFKQSRVSGNQWRTSIAVTHSVVSAEFIEEHREEIKLAIENDVPLAKRCFFAYATIQDALLRAGGDIERQIDNDMLAADSESFDPSDETTFAHRACMQLGCNAPCDVLLRVTKMFNDDSSERAWYDGGAYRLFCGEHMQRGEGYYEDVDEYYERAWARAGAALPEPRPQGHTTTLVEMRFDGLISMPPTETSTAN